MKIKPILKGIQFGYGMDICLKRNQAMLKKKKIFLGFYRLHELWVEKNGDFVLEVPNNINQIELNSLNGHDIIN